MPSKDVSLYENLCDPNLIARCAGRVKNSKPTYKRKRSRGSDGISIQEFFEDPEQLTLLQESLRQKTFKFSSLKGIPIPKDGEKDRLITAPSVGDRVVQKAVLAIINPILFPHINTGLSYCGVKKDIFSKPRDGLNARKAIEKLIWHIKNKHFWVLKADIEKFFDKVPKDKMQSELEGLLPDTSLNNLIKQIIFFNLSNRDSLQNKPRIDLPNLEIGISQGSSLSPLFANVYLKDFDLAIKNKFGDVMIRYVDDLLIMMESEEEIKEIRKFIEEFLKTKELNLSSKKTYTCNLKLQNLEFLGLSINRWFIKEKSLKDIFHHIQHNLFNPKFEEYRHLKTPTQRIECMNQKIQGLFNYYQYYHVDKLASSMNSLISKQISLYPKYKGLKLIDISKIHPVITPKEWQSLFKKASN